MNPLVTKLGYGPQDRLVIFHADDVGMCHGSNRAFRELSAAGILQCGSVMAPCPWAAEILGQAQANPALDIGVHLTLTSEWGSYRWGPLTTRDPASGLVDDEGCFWRRVPQVQAQLHVAAAERELRAQIERVIRAGVTITHLDTHMGVATIPELLPLYVALGFEYGVPVLLMRQVDEYMQSLGLVPPDQAAWQAVVADFEARGMPLVDWFRITPAYHLQDWSLGRAAIYETILRELPPGVTYFSLHPNAPGEIEAIEPDRAYWRTFEYEYFQSKRLRDFLTAERITPIGYRAIHGVMQAMIAERTGG
jgi:hypothetical protein